MNMTPEEIERIRQTMERQEDERILFIARNTTPFERIQWVEEMLKLFGPFKRIDDTCEKLGQNPKSL